MLGAAAQRTDLCLVAPPTLKGATVQKVASKLISAGFVKEVKAKASDPIWRRNEESGTSDALKLTAAGANAIAVDEAAEPEHAGGEGDAPANRDQPAILSRLDGKNARPAEAMEPGPAGPSAPRGGSKLARVIALLERDHGAILAELIATTGWLAHTTRAALTGLRKRGYAVAIDRSDDNRGSFYRIPAGETGIVEAPGTPRRRAGRSRAGRSRKPITRPDGWAPTTARRGRRSASPAAPRGRQPSATRPMRTEARALVIDALRDAHHWLVELTTSPHLTIESLAFLCPTLVTAAIDGRLPRGFGVKRLMDLPMVWPDQWSALGLRAPAER